MKQLNPVPLVFLVLIVLGWHFSGMSLVFIINEVVVRFIRDGVTVLALLIPIAAGMGLNFAVTVGAVAAQVGLLVALDQQVGGLGGLLLALAIGVALSIALGLIIGHTLNRVRGKEMIVTIIIGLLATCIYQFVFLAGYGSFIPCHNQEIVLSRGVGVRSMVDLAPYRDLIDRYWLINVGSVQLPMFMIMVVVLFALAITYILRTRLGAQFKAVRGSREKALLLGVDVDGVRIMAMVLSTIIASCGQLFFLQNIGMLNVYTAHMNTGVFASAALLAGGATIEQARVRHVFLGVLLFHALFIVSPQAGQNIFSNAALGEYFRSFVAYGTIAFALMMNIRQAESK
jgi:simple sugar transport system permease protein